VTYPREPFAFNSLGVAYIYTGQYERAIEPFQQALRLDPKFVTAISNRASAYMALNRYADATATLKDGTARQIGFAGSHRIAYLLAFIAHDQAAMATHLEASTGIGSTNAAYGWQGHALAFGGRVAAAHEQFRHGIDMAQQGGFKEVAAQLSIEDGEMHAIAGQCAQASAEVAQGLALNRDNISLERGSRALSLCGAGHEATALVGELERRYPDATLTQRVAVPVTTALVSLRAGEYRRVIEELTPVKLYDHSPWSEFWPPYLRGQAFLALGQPVEAAAEFNTILAHRGESPLAQLYSLAQLGAARAAAATGDVTKAREAFDLFLSSWRDADPDLASLREARQERSRLSTAGTR
jgi:tetratricopeptide (TPR) repeat protein